MKLDAPIFAMDAKAGPGICGAGVFYRIERSKVSAFPRKCNYRLIATVRAPEDTLYADKTVAPNGLVARILAAVSKPEVFSPIVQPVHVDMINANRCRKAYDGSVKHNRILLPKSIFRCDPVSIDIFDRTIFPTLYMGRPAKGINQMRIFGGNNGSIPLRKSNIGVVANNGNQSCFFRQCRSPFKRGSTHNSHLQHAGGLS